MVLDQRWAAAGSGIDWVSCLTWNAMIIIVWLHTKYDSIQNTVFFIYWLTIICFRSDHEGARQGCINMHKICSWQYVFVQLKVHFVNICQQSAFYFEQNFVSFQSLGEQNIEFAVLNQFLEKARYPFLTSADKLLAKVIWVTCHWC